MEWCKAYFDVLTVEAQLTSVTDRRLDRLLLANATHNYVAQPKRATDALQCQCCRCELKTYYQN